VVFFPPSPKICPARNSPIGNASLDLLYPFFSTLQDRLVSTEFDSNLHTKRKHKPSLLFPLPFSHPVPLICILLPCFLPEWDESVSFPPPGERSGLRFVWSGTRAGFFFPPKSVRPPPFLFEFTNFPPFQLSLSSPNESRQLERWVSLFFFQKTHRTHGIPLVSSPKRR